MTDYRALCAELLNVIDSLPCETNYKGESRYVSPIDEDVIFRARAALAQPEPEGATDEAWQEFIEQVQHAQHVASREGEGPRFDLVECALALWREAIPQAPEPEGPTDEELDELWAEIDGGGAIWAWQYFARAVLARWGRPTSEDILKAPNE
jgi:hypothetical protein